MFEKAHEAVQKMGIKLGPRLGGGCFAQVFAIEGDDTKVVKITGDESDAYVAELARQAQREGRCKNLVHVYRVLECLEEAPTSMWHDDYTSYVIVSERLQPIPDEAYMFLPDRDWDVNWGVGGMMEAADNCAAGHIHRDQWACKAPIPVWGAAACNLKGMVDDLRSLGCTEWTDFKLANVMLRPDDRIVVSDLGQTKSPIPKIERAA